MAFLLKLLTKMLFSDINRNIEMAIEVLAFSGISEMKLYTKVLSYLLISGVLVRNEEKAAEYKHLGRSERTVGLN